MTKITVSIIFMFACIIKAFAGDPILFGKRVFVVDGPLCTGAIATRKWITPTDIKIAKIQIWNGLDYGHASDVPEIVTRISDGAILIDGGHDDYANGGGIRIQSQDWAGNYFPIAAGDGLTFSYMCTDPTAHGGWIVTIWTK